jgi:hypothetical protein
MLNLFIGGLKIRLSTTEQAFHNLSAKTFPHPDKRPKQRNHILALTSQYIFKTQQNNEYTINP